MVRFGHWVRWWSRRAAAAILLPIVVIFDLVRFTSSAVLHLGPVASTVSAVGITLALAVVIWRALIQGGPAAVAAASANEVRDLSHPSIVTVEVKLTLNLVSALRAFMQAASLALCAIGLVLVTLMQAILVLHPILVASAMLLSAWLMHIA